MNAHFARIVVTLVAGAIVLAVPPAKAAGGDAAAQQAADHAMNDLFMATKFDEAKGALEKSIQKCEEGCSDPVRGRLYRDLGVVYITGFHDTKHGTKAFKKARVLDPGIQLDPVITTPEIQTAFDAAASGAAPPPESAGPEAPVVLEDESEEGGKKKKHKKKHHAEEPAEDERVVVTCAKDSDCEANQMCKLGECAVRPPPPVVPVVWLSVGLIQDMLFVSGTDVCTKKSQVESGFTCIRASGSQYHGTPLPGKGGSISFTPAFATTRVSLSSYIPISGPVSGGLRMAYAFAGEAPQADGGKQFVFYQAEAIGAYWLSGDAFSTKQIGTFLQASGGVAEIDGSASVTVNETPNVFQTQGGIVPPANQLYNPPTQKLDAYQRTGSGFAAVGAGVFLPFGSASGLLADLRFMLLFPTSGFAMSLGVSGVLGL
jgi:hypothetical protein